MKKSRFIASVFLAVMIALSLVAVSSAQQSAMKVVPDNYITIGTWCCGLSVCAATPPFGVSGCWAVTLIWGKGFRDGAVVELARGDSVIVAEKAWVICPSCIKCVIDLRGATPGWWDIRVKNPNGCSSMLKNGYQVLCNPLLPPYNGGVDGDTSSPEGKENINTPPAMIDNPPANPIVSPRSPGAPVRSDGEHEGDGPSHNGPAPGESDPERRETKDTIPDSGGAETDRKKDEKSVNDGKQGEDTNVRNNPSTETLCEGIEFNPRSGKAGELLEYTVTGFPLVPNIIVILRKGDRVLMSLNGEIIGESLKGTFYLGDVSPGEWQILLKMPSGKLITVKGILTVYE